MAIFNWKIISYPKGQASPHSDYIWGQGQFSAKDDVIATGYGNLPSWCQGNPNAFFCGSDRNEREKGSAAKELVLSLPNELSLPAWIALVEELIARDIGKKPYQYAIHLPLDRDGENAHPHAHILYSDRIPDEFERDEETFFSRHNPKDPAQGGCKKDGGGKSPAQVFFDVLHRKRLWAELQNSALAAAGHAAQVDHRPKRAPRGPRNPEHRSHSECDPSATGHEAGSGAP